MGQTNTDELKRLAEDLRFKGRFAAETEREAVIRRNERNDRAAEAILALIADNGRLKAEKEGLYMQFEAVTQNCFRFLAQRDGAMALLRANMMYPDDGKTANETQAFLSRIDSQKEPAE